MQIILSTYKYCQGICFLNFSITRSIFFDFFFVCVINDILQANDDIFFALLLFFHFEQVCFFQERNQMSMRSIKFRLPKLKIESQFKIEEEQFLKKY